MNDLAVGATVGFQEVHNTHDNERGFLFLHLQLYDSLRVSATVKNKYHNCT